QVHPGYMTSRCSPDCLEEAEQGSRIIRIEDEKDPVHPRNGLYPSRRRRDVAGGVQTKGELNQEDNIRPHGAHVISDPQDITLVHRQPWRQILLELHVHRIVAAVSDFAHVPWQGLSFVAKRIERRWKYFFAVCHRNGMGLFKQRECGRLIKCKLR